MLNEVNPLSHHATEKFTLFALVPSRASLGNDVRDVQNFHADAKLLQFLMSVVLKSLSDAHPSHERYKLVAKGISELKLASDAA